MTSTWSRAGAAGGMLLAAGIAVSFFGASSGAQTDPATPIVSPGIDDQPAVTDDGNIVVFRSTDAAGISTIRVHNRLAATTAPLLADIPGSATSPSISGDGCVAAFIVPGTVAAEIPEPDVPQGDPVGDDPVDPVEAAEPEGLVQVEPAAFQVADPAQVRVVDRCTDPDSPTELAPIVVENVDRLSRPALSADGAALIVSDGQDVLRYGRDASGAYVFEARFDGPAPSTPEVLTSSDLAVSDDGSIVVFSSGTDLDDVETLTVNVWDVGVVSALQPAATSPSVSGDGSVVAFQDAVGVSVVDRSTTGASPAPLAPGGARPAISADGNHIVYEAGDRVRVVSWSGQGSTPFDVTESFDLSGVAAPTGAGAAIDRLGATVVTDLPDDPNATETDVSIVAIAADGSFSSAAFDLGVGNIAEVLSAQVSFTNDGPATMSIDDLVVESPFVLGDTTCADVLRRGSTCTIEVSITIERFEDVFGTVTLTGSGVEYTTELEALGEEPAATTTTTTPTSTTGGTTTGTTTGGTTTTTGTTSTTGGTTSSTRTTSSTGGRVTTTTTTTVPGAGINFSPASFDFAPTIIEAGRRPTDIEIVNSSSSAVSIIGVRVEPESGAFEILETTCAGESLAASARCSITVEFAPTVEGQQNARLIASLDGGFELEAALTGIGAPPPVVNVVPAVATTGQVVTVRGSGFPTGAAILLSWSDGLVEHDIVIDDAGTFDLPIVVMPHTPNGPLDVSIPGQDGQFGDIEATMLVTATGERSGPAVLDGVGPNIGR